MNSDSSDSVSEARARLALRRDQIERELTVIEKIDRIFLRDREHSSTDVVGYEARQQRKRDLLRLLDEHRN